ncbi:PLP-dependent aminotransferase family protein [Sphingobacterium oryzagri]|uniref:PLP-dependent aminotransferase family protein n=1 Tax=Sphingobacterium oryzagri TaxID=3025669 RepID=A0ABY7WK17_9SPHI|nr:PLP-dependent aminotransferase family protein [Sphingobacterium sp. KACC 22765]WDF69931.1 PLP-dependent aminotransferase family protein [Sphingobacterium sp. KACC 22765]
MPSPVEIPYRSFIVVDRSSNVPVYLQIANEFIKAIQRHALPPTTRLLGTRSLGQLLAVHRNTVVSAYDELAAQGWITILANKGTFVSAKLPILASPALQRHHYPSATGFAFKRSSLLDNPYEHRNYAYLFNDGTPDIRLTQIADLSRVYSSTMKRKSNRKKMDYYNHEGSEYFKTQLGDYLRLSRGLPIASSNILITRSTEMSLYIISEILLQPDDIVVVGEWGYFSANMIFQKNAARLKTVPVDEEGIDIAAVRKLCETQRVRMLYVNPQQHYPTTVTMSAKRRMELLQLAQTFGFAIVEDDYDQDFYYDKQPMLPLAAADQHGMVIYVGSFGKSLAPGFRTGFIVAPENIMLEMRKHLGIIDRQGDVLMEQALGEMIEDGVIYRHLKKSLKIYRERRDHMLAILKSEFNDCISVRKPAGGLACWLQFTSPVNLLQLSRNCAKSQLFLPKTILYQNKDMTALRLGFGHLDTQAMNESMAILRQHITALL